jgi:hypothetical protein
VCQVCRVRSVRTGTTYPTHRDVKPQPDVVTVEGVIHRLRTLLVAVLGLAALTLGACQDDDPEATPSSSSSPTSVDSTATSGEPTPTGDSSSVAPSDSVAPAAGPELHLRVMSVHAPVGWENDEGQVSRAEVSASSADGLLQLIELEGATYTSTADSAADFIKSVPYADKIERLPDVVIGPDQTPAARVAWTEKGTKNHYEAIMAYKDGVDVSLNITIRPPLQKKDPLFVESVLASVQWLV